MATEPEIASHGNTRYQPAGRRRQGGQAIVEYAILVTVIVLVAAGGVELATAAFNFYQAKSSAEAGASGWAYEVNQVGTYSTGPDFTITAVNSRHGQPVGIGDHSDPTVFSRPSCGMDPSADDDGLPANSITQGGNEVYLFNPRPVDVTDCIGQGRISGLISILPRLNQAVFPLYDQRCADNLGNEIACTNSASVASTYLRLPGKLDAASDTVTLAQLNYDLPPTDPAYQELVTVAPTFALRCKQIPGMLIDGGTSSAPVTSDWTDCDSSQAPRDICWEDSAVPSSIPYACDVLILVRYRHIFHSFLQFPFVYWRNPLPQSALDELDLGPDGIGGIVGSEVGLGNVRLFNRSVKWCFQTNTLPPTDSMRGERTVIETNCPQNL